MLLGRGVSVIRSLFGDHFVDGLLELNWRSLRDSAVHAADQDRTAEIRTSDVPAPPRRSLHCVVGDDRCDCSSYTLFRCHSQQSTQWHGGGRAETDFSPSSHLNLSSTFPPIKAESQTSQLNDASRLHVPPAMGATKLPYSFFVCQLMGNPKFVSWGGSSEMAVALQLLNTDSLLY
jgi:hypothetical protein